MFIFLLILYFGGFVKLNYLDFADLRRRHNHVYCRLNFAIENVSNDFLSEISIYQVRISFVFIMNQCKMQGWVILVEGGDVTHYV